MIHFISFLQDVDLRIACTYMDTYTYHTLVYRRYLDIDYRFKVIAITTTLD